MPRKKPGPKSFLEKCRPPKRTGLKGRMIHRYVTQLMSKEARSAYRKGFRAMWRFASSLMRKWKVPKPGDFDKTNVMGGEMWGSFSEWKSRPITANRIGLIFEECALNFECSDSVLCQISKCMSFLFLLQTGEPGRNWKTLPGLKLTLKKRKKIATQQTVKPEHVVTPDELTRAFTTEWRPNKGMSLLSFLASAVMAWDSHVLGSRPNVDIKKIKDSENHWFSPNKDIWYTELVGGRAKLPLEKAGTRRWCAFRLCLCKNGKHISPDKNFFRTFDDDGNTDEDLSSYCTTCPVFAGEVLKQFQDHEELPFRAYRRLLLGKDRKRRNRSLIADGNVGPVKVLAARWLEHQGVAIVSANSGRKCLARWLSKSEAPYHQSFQIMADLESVWRANYQPDLAPSGFKNREQSQDPHVATAALQRFRKLCGRAPPPPAPLPGMTKTDQVLQMMCTNLGWLNSFNEIFN